MDVRKQQLGNVCSFIVSKVCSCLCTWTTSTSKKETEFASLVGKMDETSGSEEPTTLLDQVYIGYTQRECKLNNSLVEDYRKMSSHEFPQELPTTWPDTHRNALNVTANWKQKHRAVV